MTIRLGAVIYDPKVTVIWKIIAEFFAKHGIDLQPVFFKNYALQVDALLADTIDIAWNSPLAWLDAFLRSNGTCLNGPMRDTDQNRSSYLVVKKEAGYKAIADLRGKTIGFGAVDSPQARLIPISFLHKNGLEFEKDYNEKRFDIGVGLHGDHVGGELDGAKALIAGQVDAAWMLDLNYQSWIKNGTLDERQVEKLAVTPHFDHCIFSGRTHFDANVFKLFEETLYKMDYNNPEHKEMMDLEGLKKWVPGRTIGFEQITAANEYLKVFK